MPLVPINITGQQYQSRSGQLSNQVTQNFYAELVEDPFGKAKYVLQPTPGAKFFGIETSASGSERGIFEHLGILYAVVGTSLFSVDSSGTHTSLGTIAGSNRCIFAGIGSSVVIVNGSGVPYVWNGSTLTTVTDPDLETPNGCAHLRNVIIYDGDGGRFATSDVGDATSIDALNYATAETNADNLKRVFTFDDRAWMFGDKTIEPWWFSGVGNPPLDPVQGGILQIGLDALHSVSANDKSMYWLGDDKQVYRYSQGVAIPISNIAMHSKISSYSTTSDAIGFNFTFEGQNFYFLTFPTQDTTWLYNEKTGWTTMDTSGGRSMANSYAFAFGKHLIADKGTSQIIFEWSPNFYHDNYNLITRIRDTAPIHGGLYGLPGSRVEQNDLRMIMEVGTGLDDALVYQSNTSDTVSTPDSANIGVTGDIDIRVELTPRSWTGTTRAILSRWDTGQKSYLLQLNSSGTLSLQLSSDGTATVTAQSTAGTGFSDNVTRWIRATWVDSTDKANFYTSTDGSTWTQLGNQNISLVSSGIFDGTSALSVGGVVGELQKVQVYSGVGGTLKVNMDPNDWVSGSTWTASTTGEIWTLNGTSKALSTAADPSITLSISDDGGNTFSSEISASLGAASDFQREVRWNALGSFTDGRILRIKSTSRVFTSIHGASSYIGSGI